MKASQAGFGSLGLFQDPSETLAGQGIKLDPSFVHLLTCAVCQKEQQNRYGRHTHYPSQTEEATCCRECEKRYVEGKYSTRIIAN